MMGKTKKIKKKFATFANQLSPYECQRQLVLAYLQMERCMQVLRGADVEPVAVKGSGASPGMELFYMCKKIREELDYLNHEENPQNEHEQDEYNLSAVVDIDTPELNKHLKELKKALGGILPTEYDENLEDEVVRMKRIDVFSSPTVVIIHHKCHS